MSYAIYPAHVTESATDIWQPDLLGPGYRALTLELGDDPDGESPIAATLVRREPQSDDPEPTASVLYVHGLSDYFFQTDLADAFAARGYRFYALDLRKCGRSRRPGQTGHHITDLRRYDLELEWAISRIAVDLPDAPVVAAAHSTGGLIAAWWAQRRRQKPVRTPLTGLVLNSPFLDLHGSALLRTVGTGALRGIAAAVPGRMVPLPTSSAYGDSIHVSRNGEWDYNLDFKPLGGFGVTFGFINAVRRAQADLHRGWDTGTCSLVLRSDTSALGGDYRPEVDRADCVLDVHQIAQWAGCLGGRLTSVPVPGARHDVFLSQPDARAAAYAELDEWLRVNESRLKPDPVIAP